MEDILNAVNREVLNHGGNTDDGDDDGNSNDDSDCDGGVGGDDGGDGDGGDGDYLCLIVSSSEW